VVDSEGWKTFQPCDTELAVIRLPEEVFPYLRKVWTELCNLQVGTVWKSMYTIKVFYLPTDAQQSCFKRILKFKLKQLLHVSV